MADITTRRMLNAIDVNKTVINGITSMSPDHAAIPAVVDNDKEAVRAAMKTSSEPDPAKNRLAYIRNTLRLDKIAVSDALLKDIEDNKNIEIIERDKALHFDEKGNLIEIL